MHMRILTLSKKIKTSMHSPLFEIKISVLIFQLLHLTSDKKIHGV